MTVNASLFPHKPETAVGMINFAPANRSRDTLLVQSDKFAFVCWRRRATRVRGCGDVSDCNR